MYKIYTVFTISSSLSFVWHVCLSVCLLPSCHQNKWNKTTFCNAIFKKFFIITKNSLFKIKYFHLHNHKWLQNTTKTYAKILIKITKLMRRCGRWWWWWWWSLCQGMWTSLLPLFMTNSICLCSRHGCCSIHCSTFLQPHRRPPLMTVLQNGLCVVCLYTWCLCAVATFTANSIHSRERHISILVWRSNALVADGAGRGESWWRGGMRRTSVATVQLLQCQVNSVAREGVFILNS